MTIEQLLTHTSGIGDYLDEEADWDVFDHVLSLPVHTLTTAEAFLSMLEGQPQKAPPGEGFSYCNGGYMVLAIVLERITGETFQEAVRRLVLEPAGLEATGFPPLNALPADAALGYVFDEGDLVNTLHLPVLGNGDGGAFTTAADLHRFWLALLDGRIVSRETVEQMMRPRNDVPDEQMRAGRACSCTRPTRCSCSRATTPALRSARGTSSRRRPPSASSATAPRAAGR